MENINKQQVMEILNKYNFDKNEYVVISGASMVMHNIKDYTNDVDISVSKKLYNELLENYNCEFERYDEQDNVNIYFIDGIINFSTNYFDVEYEIIDGIKFQTIDSILELKQKLNREKDQLDIQKIIEKREQSKEVTKK